MLNSRIGLPVLGDGPVSGSPRRRFLKDVLEVGHGASLVLDANLLKPLRTRGVTAHRVDAEPLGLVGPGQGLDLGVMLQNILGGIDDEAALRPDGKDAIEGLIGLDRPGQRQGTRIGRIDVDDHAGKGLFPVSDDLSKTETGCANLGHGPIATPLCLSRRLVVSFIFATDRLGADDLPGVGCRRRVPFRTTHLKARPMPEIDDTPAGRDGRSPRFFEAAADAPLYGALDLGTNNCRLLIARPARDGFRVVDSFSRIVRLGEGLTRTGRLDDGAMDRAYEALGLCAERVAKRGVTSARLSAVATQACRQAENGAEFVDRVKRGTGLTLRIIDPVEEARLAVEGCRNLFDPNARAILVIDVGGGSTELSWLRRSERGLETVGWLSAPIGVVTLAERHPEPTDNLDAWYEAMVADMTEAIADGPVDPDLRAEFDAGRAHLVGTSGAITSLAGIHLRLARYQRDRIDGLWMKRADCEAAADRLLALGPAGRAAEACIGPERADLVLAGAAILEAVQRAWPCDRVRVADRGLREGLLLQRMREDRRNPRSRRRRRGRS